MRFKFFLFSLFVTIATCAQNQRGLVRTIGTSSHHGVPVAGATIKVKGNSQQYLSDNKGAFSLSMHSANAGDKFQLLNVTKRGYELADKDFLSKTFAYSSQSLLEIVLLSTEEMEKEKQAIEDRVFKIAKDNYEKKRDGLKHEQEQGLITIEDYRAKLKTLHDQYDTFDEILSAMAEHYARTDYDRLDSLDVLINTHIINGELDEADMLVAKKGNLNDRIAAYQRHAATNEAAREMLDKLTDELRDQHLAYEKERDDIANDLYNKHSIAISRFDFDQALEMLKLRADLDTTNMEAVWDYATLCYKQKKVSECEKYFQICLGTYLHSNDYLHQYMVQMNLGSLYDQICDYENCFECYNSALECVERLSTINSAHYNYEQFVVYNGFGILYSKLKDFSKSENYFKLALEKMEFLCDSNPEAYRKDVADTQMNLGNLYCDVHNYVKAETLLLLAFENYYCLFNENPNVYRKDLANIQLDLGNLYREIAFYSYSETFYLQALDNYEQLYRENPDAYRWDLANCQNNIGLLYFTVQDYASCEVFYRNAMDNYNVLNFQDSNAYSERLAMINSNMGSLQCTLQNYTQSIEYLKVSIDLYNQLLLQYPDAYREELAGSHYNLGIVYSELLDYVNAEYYYLMALETRLQLFSEKPEIYRPDVAVTLLNIGNLYHSLKDYTTSEKYYLQSLMHYEMLYGQYPELYLPSIAMTHWNMVLLYSDMENIEQYNQNLEYALRYYTELYASEPELYCQNVVMLQLWSIWRLLNEDKNNEVMEMLHKLQELNPHILTDDPNGIILINELKSRGLIN